MTERQWLACKDPNSMDLFLSDRGPLDGRKYRLFGCTCVRDVWDDLPGDVLRDAVEVCERFADGLATAKQLAAARKRADAAYEGVGDIVADHSAIVVTSLCGKEPWFPMGEGSASGISAVAAELRATGKTPWHVARARARKLHAQLYRDVFGNPFRPVAFDPAWRTSTAVRLAEGIYADRAFDRLPILADALQDAGCENADVLNHCRDKAAHCRGCWVVDLVLGKS